MKVLTVSFFMLIFLFPIAALAADATAPSAPAVQSAVWTAEDYLRAALSGAAGGLISGFVALVIGWMNNRNALKLNQQKIDADKENLKLQLEQKEKELSAQLKMQIKKLHTADIKNLCTEFLAITDPSVFVSNTFDYRKMILCAKQISIYCDVNSYLYFENIVNIITNREMWNFGSLLKTIKEDIDNSKGQLQKYARQHRISKIRHDPEALALFKDEFKRNLVLGKKFSATLNQYARLHQEALNAAKKIIWGETV